MHRQPQGHDDPQAVDAATYLARIAGELAGEGLVIATAMLPGDALTEELTRAAEARAADLIVMATHGRGGLSRVVLGSVAERVLAQSSVPVLLLRPDGRRVTS